MIKIKEFLKLKPGDYLLTDDICNYRYILKKYVDNNKEICMLGQIFSYFEYVNKYSPHISLFRRKTSIYKNDYYDYEKISISSVVAVGGITLHDEDFYFRDLYLVGSYNKDSMVNDIKNFKLHQMINKYRYDKKFMRDIKLKRK